MGSTETLLGLLDSKALQGLGGSQKRQRHGAGIIKMGDDILNGLSG